MKQIPTQVRMILTILALIVLAIVSSFLPKSSDSEDKTSKAQVETSSQEEVTSKAEVAYTFRNDKLLSQHFEKHSSEFSYETKEEYEAGASAVVNNPNSLSKTEAEDGDLIYYLEASNEFVVVSTDGYIRTYFKPSGGIDYYNRK